MHAVYILANANDAEGGGSGWPLTVINDIRGLKSDMIATIFRACKQLAEQTSLQTSDHDS
jgi:hypothetical protein